MRPIGKMIYRIDASNGIEARIGERQPLSSIALIEFGAPLIAQFPGTRLGTGNCFSVQIDARDVAPGLLCDA